MAFKDRFEKIVSYFDTDEASEMEEDVVEPTASEPIFAQEQGVPRPSHPVREEAVRRPQPRPDQQSSVARDSRVLPSYDERPVAPTPRPNRPSTPQPVAPQATIPNRPQPAQQTVSTSQGQMKIALKYPRRYEDAPAIVDLLINNECVLIDFEHMLDAQARRCLDFLDGASKVLYGSLQKVGTTMYLLAPANVVVDIEELMGTRPSSEASYNYDMQRR